MHSKLKAPSPTQIAELNDLPFGVRDFIFVEGILEKDYLFVAISDMRISSRIDAYITNITFPWEKDIGAHVTVGALVVYSIDKDSKNELEWKFEKRWAKSYPYQTNILVWEVNTKLLCLGMDDGNIYILRLPLEYKFLQYEEVATLKFHSARVMGIAIDYKNSFLISIGEDKKLVITDLNYMERIFDNTIGSFPLKTLIYDPEFSRIFIANGGGELIIYQISHLPPSLLRHVESASNAMIRGMVSDYNKNYLFTCAFDGIITIFDLGAPGKERFVKPISKIEGMIGARYLEWRSKLNELIVSYENGQIIIFNTKQGVIQCIIFN